MWPFTSNYWSLIDAKRAEREEALVVAPSYLAAPEKYDVYLKATAPEIVKHIERHEWTATQVVEAYCARAAYAQATTNCLTEVLFAGALLEAAALDKEFEATGKLRGPLHGVPVSFKDTFNIAGYDTTIGFSRMIHKPSQTNALLVEQFRAAGAIIIAKTNIPQTLLTFECSNPLWGRTINPHNDAYTSGGSSGGEGALVAMDGVALGLGTDIGGSVRIPAAYCGIYSLKPGVRRISKDGVVGLTPGYEGVQSVVGPMARSIDELELACRVAFGHPDPAYNPVPILYREVTLPSKLRFGYYTTDSFVKASPASKRAVLETVEALRRQGHECVEFSVPYPERAVSLFIAISSSDGYKKLLSHLGPDRLDKSMWLLVTGPRLPWIVRKLLLWVIKYIARDPVFASMLEGSRVKSVSEYYDFCAQRDEFIKLWYKEVWHKHDFDGVIAPVQAMPCIPHGGASTVAPIANGTILFNIVDSPSGVIPVTHVDPALDKLTDEWTHVPGVGSRTFETRLYKGPKAMYQPEKMKGLPVAVQIVGRRWEEEKVLAMMRVVDNALGPRGFGPFSWKGQVKG